MLHRAFPRKFQPVERLEEWNTIRLRSFKGEHWYNIYIDRKTCDCAAFDKGNGCKHLAAIGIHRLKPFTPKTHPTFSQALSALVKSIRLRRVEDAVYWLIYLDSFKEPQYRFRTARRLLIASAEDGHSVPVMEEVGRKFGRLSKPTADLIDLVAEAIRICKLPNWWHPNTGGPDYIYSSLLGQRAWLYKAWDHNVTTPQNEVGNAIAEKNRAMALGAVMAFVNVRPAFGATKQAEFLLQCAERIGHDLAARLCRVHLSAKSALSGDNNFLCQAVWLLAGGESPVAEEIPPVSAEQCHELLERAKERWKNPEPIPRWCCDGIHCAGDDPRLPDFCPKCGRCAKHFSTMDEYHRKTNGYPVFDAVTGCSLNGLGSAQNEDASECRH